MDWRVSVPGVPAVVGIARRLVRAALDGSPRADDAELIVSELVTNAIRHTPSGDTDASVSVRITHGPGWARIEVRDLGDAHWARPALTGDQDEHGRGLAIVAALADKAGHAPENGGQVSWAELSWDTSVSVRHEGREASGRPT